MTARLRVNPITCEAHGLCAELLPELIRLDDWGYPIIDEAEVPDELLGLARKAADACPTLALLLDEQRGSLTSAVPAARAPGRPRARRDEVQLPPADVPPRTGLEPDPPVDPDWLEAEPLVQGDAGLVRERDAGADHLHALAHEQLEQRPVEGAADAATVVDGVEIHADVRGPAIGRAFTVLARRRQSR